MLAAVWALVASEQETPDQARARMGQERSTVREVSGERRLVLAMLEDALTNCTTSPRRRRREFAAEDRAWIMSEEQHAFGFEFCCEVLGVSAESIRCALLRWEAEGARPRLVASRLGDNRRQRFPRRKAQAGRRIVPLAERGAA